MSADPGPLRIGEFARRVGVNPELLRAWERRYGLLQPVRSAGGFRLYTAADADRVARMRRALDDGLSAAEAAAVAVGERAGEPPADGLLDDAADRLLAAIRAYDEAAVQSVLDSSLAAFGVEAVLREVILPTLQVVGDDWENGRLDISQEHFASNLIRGRLLSLARLWGRGGGPLAILACPPGEAHDISLLAFGLVLRSHGWRILFLGADTPIETLTHAAEATQPALAVVTAFDGDRLEAQTEGLARLAKLVPVGLSGPGASEEFAAAIGARLLDADLTVAAASVATV